MLFRRLAVFAGGFTLDAAEAVTEATAEFGVDFLVGILSLVEASLLTRSEAPDGVPRYRMLETVREFGLEQLAASGEADGVMERLAAWALALAAPGTSRCSVRPHSAGWSDARRSSTTCERSWAGRSSAADAATAQGLCRRIWPGSGMSAGT